MNYIKNNLISTLKTIRDSEKKYHRQDHSVTLLAVTKKQSIAAIREAALNGQRAFGENYLQEALEKIIVLQELNLEWHFIGKIQANKTKKIAEHFSWVHSVCDEKIAKRLNEQRPSHLPPLNICIEVNIDAETTKNGLLLTQVPDLAQMIKQLPHLKLRGLMALPKPQLNIDRQRATFAKLHTLYTELNNAGLNLDTLSMGTSKDFLAAIAEGATIVRVGTTIFGSRDSLNIEH